ncbi:MAG: Dyp-type peroxidase [Magnetococcales bacterium]|nr:Dyp-type peroxidase [Magnetococcales bacterium]
MTIPTIQPGILEPIPALGRAVEFHLLPEADAESALRALRRIPCDGRCVIGLGAGLVHGRMQEIPGLRPFPAMSGPGWSVPSTQADLWCWMRGEDRGHLFHDARALDLLLREGFEPVRGLDLFKYDRGLDLTGYEDGTENPTGDEAVAAACLSGTTPGLDGSSFVAVQQWRHDFVRFDRMSGEQRDEIIGRRLEDNEELESAPASAHVKRTAQESFDPEAFVLRRSMPWADASGAGLCFIAFGRSLDPFEAQLRRMTGQEDGIVDGLFRFSRPLTGGYFWCPPVGPDGLNLMAIGIPRW